MGQESHLYLLLFACQRAFQLPYAIYLAEIRAHGWDPLVPTATGVLDGLQEAPGYLIMRGEYRGLTLLAELGWACIVRRRMVNGLDQWLGPTPRKCGRERFAGCATRLWSLLEGHISAECTKIWHVTPCSGKELRMLQERCSQRTNTLCWLTGIVFKSKSNLSRNLCENLALAYDSFGSMAVASAYPTTLF
jgi:hypothetical protein